MPKISRGEADILQNYVLLTLSTHVLTDAVFGNSAITITFDVCMCKEKLEGEQKKVEWLKTWPLVKSPQFWSNQTDILAT